MITKIKELPRFVEYKKLSGEVIFESIRFNENNLNIYKINRPKINEFNHLNKIKNNNFLYLLFGKRNQIYIDLGNNLTLNVNPILRRYLDHDWINSIYVITFDDSSLKILNNLHFEITSLFSNSIRNYRIYQNHHTHNGENNKKVYLNLSDKHLYDSLLENIKQAFELYEIDLTQIKSSSAKAFDVSRALNKTITNVTKPILKDISENDLFQLNFNGKATAFLKREADKFVLLKGSQISLDEIKNDTRYNWIKNKRELLIKNKIVNKKGIVLKDIEWTSPSILSSLVKGKRSNGWIAFKNSNQQTLNDIYRTNNNSSNNSGKVN